MKKNLLKLLVLSLISPLCLKASETFKAPQWKNIPSKTTIKKMHQAEVEEDSKYSIQESFESSRGVASEEEEADYSTRRPSSTIKKKKKKNEKRKKYIKTKLPKHWKFDSRSR